MTECLAKNSPLSLVDLLKKCQEMKISITLHEGKLKIQTANTNIPAHIIESLKSHKAQLLVLLSNNNEAILDDESTVVHMNEQDRCLLSPLQRSMWAASKFADDGGMLSYCSNTKIMGKLDITALENALNYVLNKHKALRMLFDSNETELYQHLAHPSLQCLFVYDCRDKPEHVSKLIDQATNEGFNLETGLKLKAVLIRHEQEEYSLFLACHHIVTDGWSIDILMNDISTYYNQLIIKKPLNNVDDSQVTWVDYVHWLEKDMERNIWPEAKEYWQKRLNGAPALHGLPLDYTRPPTQSFNVERFTFTYPLTLTSSLRKVAQDNGSSLYVVLLCAFSLLISKLSGEEDMILGSSVANRPREEFSKIIGLFTNVLAMRMKINKESTFLDFLENTHENYLEDIDHQFLPFGDVVLLCDQVERSLVYSPLVQIAFAMQNNEFGGIQFDESHCSTTHLALTKSQYDLGVSVSESENGLIMHWDYATDIFKKSTINCFSNYLENIFQEICTEPNKKIKNLSLLKPSKILQLYKDINTTHQALEHSPIFFHRFETMAASYPNKIALITDKESWTYEQLNIRANQIAYWLCTQYTIERDSLVAICMERNNDMLASLLAILKTGAAYVPLDPAYPLARLQHMLDQSHPLCLLSSNKIMSDLKLNFSSIETIDNRNTAEKIVSAPKTNLLTLQLQPEQLAYVNFTSGSTGLPKGVMIEHSNLSNFLYSMEASPGLQQNDTVLAVTSTSFDIHILELFLPLTCGATAVLANTKASKDPAMLISLINEHQVNVMQATPVTWKLLFDDGWKPKTSFKALCGGEALIEGLADKFHQNQNLELWNMYGPTETTVWSTIKKVTAGITLGKPIANTRIYVLDHEYQPLPSGAIGELFIGGDGLARGYLNNQKLTTEKFISVDLNKQAPNALPVRLYRTGDLCKLNESNELIYLGRADTQIKIRGFRVELGEIETIIYQTGIVKNAGAVVRKNSAAKYICAFVTIQNGLDHKNSIAKIRTAIAEKLPDYMQPSRIEILENLPLTNNGKIDRKSLVNLPLSDNNPNKNQNNIVNLNVMESTILNVFSEVLGIEKSHIAINDNFYYLGGDSVTALRLVASLRRKNIEISAQSVVASPTIHKLAEVAKVVVQNAKPIEIYTGKIRPTVDQASVLSREKCRKDNSINGILDLKESINIKQFKKALYRTAIRHATLRSKAVYEQEWMLEIAKEPTSVEVEKISISYSWSDIQLKNDLPIIVRKARDKLDVLTGIHWHFVIIENSKKEQKLLFVLSHILIDGYSTGIILQDIFSEYANLCGSIYENSVTTPPAINTWSDKFNDFYNRDDQKNLLEYWESLPWQKIEHFNSELKSNDRDNEVIHSTIAFINVKLGEKHTQQLKSGVSKALGVSPLTFMIAILVKTLQEEVSQDFLYLHLFDSGRMVHQQALDESGQDVSNIVSSLLLPKFLFLTDVYCDDTNKLIKNTGALIDKIELASQSFKILKHGVTDTTIHQRMQQYMEPDIWLNFFGFSESPTSSESKGGTDSTLPPFAECNDYIWPVTQADDMPMERSLLLPWRVVNNDLEMVWQYSTRLSTEGGITTLANAYKTNLIAALNSLNEQTTLEPALANMSTPRHHAKTTHIAETIEEG